MTEIEREGGEVAGWKDGSETAGDTEGERDLCIHHCPRRVLLCFTLIERVSQALISSSVRTGPHGNHNQP